MGTPSPLCRLGYEEWPCVPGPTTILANNKPINHKQQHGHRIYLDELFTEIYAQPTSNCRSTLNRHRSRDWTLASSIKFRPQEQPLSHVISWLVNCSILKMLHRFHPTTPAITHWFHPATPSYYLPPLVAHHHHQHHHHSHRQLDAKWLSKTIDAPICQRANKFPSSASRTSSTSQAQVAGTWLCLGARYTLPLVMDLS